MSQKNKIEFGDFQTPDGFALRLVSLLRSHGVMPETVIEPTCGVGSFLVAASTVFPKLSSRAAKEFFNARIFWDAKRPISTEILQQLDIDKLPSGVIPE